MESAKKYDINGWFEVKDNPISKVGVFDYLGRNIPEEREKGNADQMFKVYRPAEELAHPDCIESFRLVPWIIDHIMLGDGTNGTVTTDEKLARGVIGEQIWFDPNDGYGTLKANIKCFSEELAQIIANGKTPLSLGYRCYYEYAPGVFEGMPYTYIQRNIRGNHVASVDEGRMGREVAVMDSSFTVDAKEFLPMKTKKSAVSVLMQKLLSFAADAEEEMKDAPAEEGGELKKALALIEELKPLMAALEELKCVSDSPEMTDEAVTVDEDDEDMKDDDKKDSDAMDSLEKLVKAEVAKALKAIPAPAPAAAPIAMDAKDVIADIAKRDKLAARLSEFIGSFDHSEMTAQQVAEYGVQKLELPVEKGSETVALAAYLHGRVAPRHAVTQTADSSEAASDWLTKQLSS